MSFLDSEAMIGISHKIISIHLDTVVLKCLGRSYFLLRDQKEFSHIIIETSTRVWQNSKFEMSKCLIVCVPILCSCLECTSLKQSISFTIEFSNLYSVLCCSLLLWIKLAPSSTSYHMI